MSRSYSYRKIYGSASILAIITLCGLLSALFGDGVWDELSWLAMAVPIAVIVWKYSRAVHGN
jgi:hypothetical protein